MNKFSILTASYNNGRYIRGAIESVMKQTDSNWEMIIVDDASTDDSIAKIKEYSNLDNRIKLLVNESNKGVGYTYNKALEAATGDLCGVLDGDDYLTNDAIKIVTYCYNLLPKIGFIWTQHNWCSSVAGRIKKGISAPPSKKNIYDTEEGFVHCYSHWRTFRKELNNSIQLFNPSLRCTIDKNLGYLLEQISNGAYLPLKLYNYRYYKGNMSHKSNQKEVWKTIRKQYKGSQRNESIVIPENIYTISSSVSKSYQ